MRLSDQYRKQAKVVDDCLESLEMIQSGDCIKSEINPYYTGCVQVREYICFLHTRVKEEMARLKELETLLDVSDTLEELLNKRS